MENERLNLEFCLEQVWPELSRRLPEARLDVFGTHFDDRLLKQCLQHPRVRPVVRSGDQGRLSLGESVSRSRPKHIANLTSLLLPGPSRW